MDFKNANELLALCEEKNLPISEIMRIREIELGETASEIVNKKMTPIIFPILVTPERKFWQRMTLNSTASVRWKQSMRS